MVVLVCWCMLGIVITVLGCLVESDGLRAAGALMLLLSCVLVPN